MLLGYKEATPGDDNYHFGKIGGVDKKYIRVLAGVILPVYERTQGAVVVIGELFQRTTPAQDFTGLGAAVGPWPEIERALKEFDKGLQFRDAILETDDLRPLMWTMRGLSMHILTAVAPKYAFNEVGRQKVDQLISDGKLHLGLIEDTMEAAKEPAAHALQAAVCWCLEFPPIYRSKPKAQPEWKPLGVTGL